MIPFHTKSTYNILVPYTIQYTYYIPAIIVFCSYPCIMLCCFLQPYLGLSEERRLVIFMANQTNVLIEDIRLWKSGILSYHNCLNRFLDIFSGLNTTDFSIDNFTGLLDGFLKLLQNLSISHFKDFIGLMLCGPYHIIWFY